MPLQAHLVICRIGWEAAPMAPRCTRSESCNPAMLRVMGWLRERLPAAHVPFSFSKEPRQISSERNPWRGSGFIVCTACYDKNPK